MVGLKGRQRDTALAFTAAATVELRITELRPNPRHPRQRCSDSDIALLADSVHQHGLLAPLWIRPLADGCYEIIAGECRWRAAQLAGISFVSCRVFNVTEDQAFTLSLIENLERSELTPLEEAQAYQEMLDRRIARNRADIARLVCVTRMRITQRMRLLELDAVTQQTLREHPDLLTEYHGRLLWEVKDLPSRHRLADKAVEERWSGGRLKAEIQEWLREREIDHWLSGDQSLPRAYTVSLPGFSLSVSFERADLYQVQDTLGRLQARVDELIALKGAGSASPVDGYSQDQGGRP
jgi:ParB/RepB/Spo0J family partition protein